jgi:hypothetical protein
VFVCLFVFSLSLSFVLLFFLLLLSLSSVSFSPSLSHPHPCVCTHFSPGERSLVFVYQTSSQGKRIHDLLENRPLTTGARYAAAVRIVCFPHGLLFSHWSSSCFLSSSFVSLCFSLHTHAHADTLPHTLSLSLSHENAQSLDACGRKASSSGGSGGNNFILSAQRTQSSCGQGHCVTSAIPCGSQHRGTSCRTASDANNWKQRSVVACLQTSARLEAWWGRASSCECRATEGGERRKGPHDQTAAWERLCLFRKCFYDLLG